MVRANRLVPSVYFGRPGALVTLPYPRGDIDRSYDRQVFDFLTGSGQHMISSCAEGSRPYTVSWNALHVDNFALIEQYWVGAMGTGPWAFIDPATTNMLMPNQASATNAMLDSTGWQTSTGAANMGTIISNTSSTFIHRSRATRSIRWQFTVAPATTPVLTVTPPYRNWFGIPVVIGLPYAFSGWVRADGVVDSSITMALKMRWLDSAGAQLSEATSGDIVVGTTFTQLSVIQTAPAGAAYVYPYLSTTGATITTGGSIYADEFLLEQDSVVNPWAPGTGVRPVEILALPETSPFDSRFRKGLGMTLRELVA